MSDLHLLKIQLLLLQNKVVILLLLLDEDWMIAVLNELQIWILVSIIWLKNWLARGLLDCSSEREHHLEIFNDLAIFINWHW